MCIRDRFGKGAALTNKKDLSQPGQFACAEKVEVIGPKGSMSCLLYTSSGKVYGYEALMRSQLPQFSSPEDILRVARSQSRLLAIEKLTIYGAIKACLLYTSRCV